MNILDPKYAARKLKNEIMVYLLFFVLFIGVIVLCLFAMIYFGPAVVGQQEPKQQYSYHDHIVDISDRW
jgi:ABC-type Na+ efflux pump permease subunit